MDLVEFELEDRRFALPMARVIELASAVRFQDLPGAPRVIEGMINHAGAPVPLVCMRAVFGMTPRDRGSNESWNDHLILARGATRVFALRVDRAIGLTYVDDAAIQTGAPSRHIAGVAVIAERDLLYIQDLDALLTAAEETALVEALVGALAGTLVSSENAHAAAAESTV